ncbi:MAG: clan AA aspartic protease [Archangiaceae bacterium]|nr:clan AA aspartic protease [Archangiaceae bacterium]
MKFSKPDPRAPLIVLPVKVNGRGRLRFLLDTGASHTCVAPQLVKALKLETSGNATALGAGGTLSLALTRIESLRIGAAEVRDLVVAVVDVEHVAKVLTHIDGVVGNDFLGQFVVTLDYRKRTVTLK